MEDWRERERERESARTLMTLVFHLSRTTVWSPPPPPRHIQGKDPVSLLIAAHHPRHPLRPPKPALNIYMCVCGGGGGGQGYGLDQTTLERNKAGEDIIQIGSGRPSGIISVQT